MEQAKQLTMEEYCLLFEHIVLAEYDNLFHNSELRRDLGLDGAHTGPFAVEYLCAALFLLDDLMPDSRLPQHMREAVASQVRSGVFRSILPDSAPEGAEAPYILYSLKRSAALAHDYARDDATMKQLVERCLDQVQLSDPVARMPQALYLMNLLPGIVQLYCDLLCSVQLESEQPVRFCIEIPQNT